MTGIKTRSGVESLITTNLPSGTGAITAANHRSVENSLSDSVIFYGEAETIVINMTTTTPPGGSPGPAGRDAYVVGSGATGAWASKDGQIAIWDDSVSPAAWVFHAPADGEVIFDRSENRRHRWDTSVSPNAWAPASRYDIPAIVKTTPPDGDIIHRQTMVVPLYFPADFAGSRGTPPDTNPDASYIITVQEVDKSTSPVSTTTLGTVTISTAGAYTFATTGSAEKTVSAGNEIQLVAPSTSPSETSIAGLSFTLMATAGDY